MLVRDFYSGTNECTVIGDLVLKVSLVFVASTALVTLTGAVLDIELIVRVSAVIVVGVVDAVLVLTIRVKLGVRDHFWGSYNFFFCYCWHY